MLRRLCVPATATRRFFHASKLEHRGVIAVSGGDAASFLQGLITNDIHQLTDSQHDSPPSMYSLMLNVQGRVINDFIVCYFKKGSDVLPANTFLLDIDKSVIPQTVALFKKYKLRRKIEISDVSSKFVQYATWDFPTAKDDAFKEYKFPSLFDDPRSALLGRRILGTKETCESILNSLSKRLNDDVKLCNVDHWILHRYHFGVPEGAIELPPGQSLPLESNCDFLNGVSFSKGCYVGQELTARTHNVGVTRKRLLPITFESEFGRATGSWKLFHEGAESLKPAGEVRSIIGSHGLALVRLQYLDPSAAIAKLIMVNDAEKRRISCFAKWPKTFPPLKPVLDKIA